MTKALAFKTVTATTREPRSADTSASVNSITRSAPSTVTVLPRWPHGEAMLSDLERDEVTFGRIRRWRTGRGHRLPRSTANPNPTSSRRGSNSDSNAPRCKPKLAPRPSRYWRSWLHAALAYILISMPTCTSRIFGVFQAIENSQVSGTIAAVEYDKVTPKVTTGDAVRSPVIVNCWTQNGDYLMTPATRCLQRRPLLTVRRSDLLPDQPAFRARHCSHRGSL